MTEDVKLVWEHTDGGAWIILSDDDILNEAVWAKIDNEDVVKIVINDSVFWTEEEGFLDSLMLIKVGPKPGFDTKYRPPTQKPLSPVRGDTYYDVKASQAWIYDGLTWDQYYEE